MLEGMDRDDIRIVEEKISQEVFTEFFRFLEESSDELKSVSGYTFKSEVAELAKTGGIESFRMIERILNSEEITASQKEFGIAALNYCRFRIENELLDIPVDMISGGLGGTANRIRYYIALTGKDGITSDQLHKVEAEFKRSADVRDSVIEEVVHHGFYISLLILGSFDYAIGDLLTSVIGECDFLQSDYFLTNVEIPNDSKIQEWLDGKLDESA
jgi:hypothetical protein